jgi:acyl carrier protein
MNEPQLRQLIADVLAGIAPEADLASVKDTEDLRDALDLDSMDFLNLVVGLAQKTGRKIPEADTPRLYTLKGMRAYLSG